MPALQRAGQRLRPRRAHHARRARRRRVDRQRPEGVEHGRAPRRPTGCCSPAPTGTCRSTAASRTSPCRCSRTASRCVRCKQMNGTRRSTRSSSPTRASRATTSSATWATAGASRSRRSPTSARRSARICAPRRATQSPGRTAREAAEEAGGVLQDLRLVPAARWAVPTWSSRTRRRRAADIRSARPAAHRVRPVAASSIERWTEQRARAARAAGATRDRKGRSASC